MLLLSVAICFMSASAQSIGCQDEVTEREVITDAIYACPGTIASGGVYGTDAEALCNTGFHVCNTASEVASLGLTSTICETIATSDTEFFATKESSGGNWRCESEYTDNSGYNDVWGCSSGSASGYNRFPCLNTLNSVIGNVDYNDWILGSNVSYTYDEANKYTLTNAASGGVLCCADSLTPVCNSDVLTCLADGTNVTRNAGNGCKFFPCADDFNGVVYVGNTLDVSVKLSTMEALLSLSQEYFALMQPDGNFVVYNITGAVTPTAWEILPIWATMTNDEYQERYMIYQTDNNWCMYSSTGVYKWCAYHTYEELNTGTNGYVIMQDDGDLCIFNGADEIIWCSYYDGVPPPGVLHPNDLKRWSLVPFTPDQSLLTYSHATRGAFGGYNGDVDPNVYVIGGSACPCCAFRYNINTMVVEDIGPLSNCGYSWMQQASFILDSKLFYATGGSAYTSNIYKFNIVTYEETYLDSINVDNPSFIMNPYTNAFGIEVLVLDTYYSTAFYTYNVETKVLTAGNGLTYSRRYPCVTLNKYDHYLYVIGGGTPFIERILVDDNVLANSFEIINFTLSDFHNITSYVGGIAQCGIISYEDWIYLINGEGNSEGVLGINLKGEVYGKRVAALPYGGCDFRLFTYADPSSIAADEGYSLVSTSDIKSGDVHDDFLTFLFENNDEIKPVADFSTGANCFYDVCQAGYVVSNGTTCDPLNSIGVWTAGETYSWCLWSGISTIDEGLQQITGTPGDTSLVVYMKCTSDTLEPTTIFADERIYVSAGLDYFAYSNILGDLTCDSGTLTCSDGVAVSRSVDLDCKYEPCACLGWDCVIEGVDGYSFYGNTLNREVRLKTGEGLLSSNGRYQAVLQNDGNFVIYETDSDGYHTGFVWYTGTAADPHVDHYLMYQYDNNLCLYRTSDEAFQYCSGTSAGVPTGYVIMQDNGYLCMFDGSDNELWCSTFNRVCFDQDTYECDGYSAYRDLSLNCSYPACTAAPSKMPSKAPSMPSKAPSKAPSKMPSEAPTEFVFPETTTDMIETTSAIVEPDGDESITISFVFNMIISTIFVAVVILF